MQDLNALLAQYCKFQMKFGIRYINFYVWAFYSSLHQCIGKAKPILLKKKKKKERKKIKYKVVTHSREYLETGIIYKTKYP